jgi:hypothetical protein
MKIMKVDRSVGVILCGVVVALLSACSSSDEGGSGSLSVLLEPEDTITGGLAAGSGEEDITDGWNVDYAKFIATVGDVDLKFSTDNSVVAEAADVFVVDLTKLPNAGVPLWDLEGLREGRWDFNYSTPSATSSAIKDELVAQGDYDQMVANGWTYIIDGTLSQTGGQSCPPASLATPGTHTANGNTSGGNACYDAASIHFSFGAPADTYFGPCEIDGVPGVAVSANDSQTVTATIHGDHLFFNGFPEGDEGGVTRLAQWLADCDLDLDGTVTQAELAAIKPSDLPAIDSRYQLGGSPITPLTSMYDYVRSQLKTQGHMNGEGECPFDGITD